MEFEMINSFIIYKFQFLIQILVMFFHTQEKEEEKKKNRLSSNFYITEVKSFHSI